MFSIIVPIYDPFDRFVPSGAIQQALEKALSLKGNYELIAVNNNPISSCPHLSQYLRSLASTHPERVKLVEPDANLGTARGFNAGMRIAEADSQYLVFMSSDTDIVDPEMLGKIQRVLDNEPSVGIAHPISVYEDSDEYNYSTSYSRRAFTNMIRQRVTPEDAEIPDVELQRFLDHVSGRDGIKTPLSSMPLTFAVITRNLINRIGAFDEGIEMICHENNDLAYRALLGGYKVARLNNVFVNHRRLLFRDLCLGEQQERTAMKHSEAIKQSTIWWNKKWGKPYIELYTRWRWGAFLFTLMRPYFWARRVGGFLKRSLV
jgi:GT2 family glycosyltransferase